MGLPAEVIDEVFTVIEGGSQLGSPGDIIQFPLDNGQGAINVVEKTYKGTNGTGFNYWVVAFETLIGEVTYAVSGGAALLATSVPAFAAALAPAMGLTVGAISYYLAPEWWDSLAEELIEAGETINGKVIAFMDENGIFTYSSTALEILLNKFVESGIYDIAEFPEYQESGVVNKTSIVDPLSLLTSMTTHLNFELVWEPEAKAKFMTCLLQFANPDETWIPAIIMAPNTSQHDPGWNVFFQFTKVPNGDSVDLSTPIIELESWTISMQSKANDSHTNIVLDVSLSGPHSWFNSLFEGEEYRNGYWRISGLNGEVVDGRVQQGARIPKEGEDVETAFPTWQPVEFPEIDPGVQIPARYPIEYPDNLPEEEPYQHEAQDPEPATETDPEKVLEEITNDENDPATGIKPAEGETDPDIGDEEEPIEDDDPASPGHDPINPDPPPIPTPIIPVPNPPSTASSNKLFTVYNPTPSQLDQLGGYLWDNDLIDILRKIWQNPLDGIISLSQVYCTPTTGSSHNIILGYLDSGVSSLVVTDQFAHIDCGTITINEDKENATDYAPYTQLQIYLPFIGITELDVNDFMAGSISVKYHIDVYTGTCLAEVKMTRTRDVPNGGIVYTFTGNCSQQIPLTSGDAKGLLAALIGAAGVGIGIAAGGAVMAAKAAGGAQISGAAMTAQRFQNAGMIASEVGHDVTREMLHVSHSGNLSANAGIMGQKKPYVIINRQMPYNANNYNKMYGFPSNKTVFLGNCTGFTRVKSGRLQSQATEIEKSEIMELLTSGVIM